MLSKGRAIFFVLLLTVLWSSARAGQHVILPFEQQPEEIPERLLVKLTNPGHAAAVSLLAAQPAIETIQPTRTARGANTPSPLDSWLVVKAAPGQGNMAWNALQKNPHIQEVHIDERMQSTLLVPNDPHFADQHGLYSPSNRKADIKAPEVWSEYTTDASDIVIAIIDCGIDANHEDLAGNMWDDGDGNHGWDIINNSPAGIASNHGTWVAGIAAAIGNNGIGVSGVAWQAQIMDVRVMEPNGGGCGGFSSDVASGIDYAVANGADVINLSLGGSYASIISNAVENAYNAGVVVVAAAGNDANNTGTSNFSPVCNAKGNHMVIGVGAINASGTPWIVDEESGSNYGGCLDVSAPGTNIRSALTNDTYGQATGTSGSAPFVAGLAALYLTEYKNATPADFLTAVHNTDLFTADDGEDWQEWNTNFKGRLNGQKVMQAGEDAGASSSPTPTPTPTPQPTPAPNLVLVPHINAAFRSVFGRNPNTTEHLYWKERIVRGDRRTMAELLGAMNWQRAAGRTYDANHYFRMTGKHLPAEQSLIPRINEAFRSIFSRNPNSIEHRYWLTRVTQADRRTMEELTSAMSWQRFAGRTFDANHYFRMTGRHLIPPDQQPSLPTLIQQINSFHRQVFGRNPTIAEHQRWMQRVVSGEKSTAASLLGAMQWHRLFGR
jgi:subtilisin family serine protease